jgi:hypothetical protein
MLSLSNNYFIPFWREDGSAICSAMRQIQFQINIATHGLSDSSSWCRISLFDNYFLSSRDRAPSPQYSMNKVIRPEVKVKSESYVSVGRNVYCCHSEGCMRSMQCNVEFGYQLSIFSALSKRCVAVSMEMLSFRCLVADIYVTLSICDLFTDSPSYPNFLTSYWTFLYSAYVSLHPHIKRHLINHIHCWRRKLSFMRVRAYLGKMSCSLVDRYNYQTKLNHIAEGRTHRREILGYQTIAFMFFVGALLGCEGCGGRCRSFWGMCCYHLRCRSKWGEDTVILTGCEDRGQERGD